MRSLVLAGCLGVSLLGLSIAAALGAEVKKKDGTVVAGEIVTEDDTGVTLRNRHGEAKIAKSDIESIDRGAQPSVEERLEKIKADTVERLKALAEAATSEKRKEAAQLIRDAIEDVKKWNTRGTDRPEEAPPVPAPGGGTATPAATAEPKPLDFVEVLKKWDRLKADPRTTSAARDQFCADMKQRPARVTLLKVVDVARSGQVYTVHGTVGAVTIAAIFEDPADVAKLVKLKPGATISAVGAIRLDASVAELASCRLK